MPLQINISFKVADMQFAEVIPSSCGIAITDLKKKLRVFTSDFK
jgi:hypothetical protein